MDKTFTGNVFPTFSKTLICLWCRR